MPTMETIDLTQLSTPIVVMVVGYYRPVPARLPWLLSPCSYHCHGYYLPVPSINTAVNQTLTTYHIWQLE